MSSNGNGNHGKASAKARAQPQVKQVSQAELKAQLNAVQKMLSAGISTSAFDWGKILQQQPDLLQQIQSNVASMPMAALGSPAQSVPANMGFSREGYPPNLYFPATFNPEYPPVLLHFYVVLWDLLKAVQYVFPECKETPKIMKMLEENIHPDAKFLRIGISEYYESMRRYFGFVERRDPSFLPNATELPFFHEMRLAEKLNDPDLDKDDINNFMVRIERLNAFSELYALVPAAVFNIIYEAAYDHLRQGNLQGGASLEQATSLGEALLHKIPQRELMELCSDKDRILIIVKDFGKLKDIPGMMNLAPIAEQIMAILDGPELL